MANSCDSAILIVTAVHGGTPLGLTIAFDWREEIDVVEIPGEGSTFVDCLGIRLRKFIASITYLVKGAITVGTIGDLVITQTDAEGDTVIDTLANMKALGHGKTGNRDSPPFAYTQNFQHQGSANAIS